MAMEQEAKAAPTQSMSVQIFFSFAVAESATAVGGSAQIPITNSKKLAVLLA